MKNCCRKCCCALFCCTCCRQTPLNVINNDTILLPKNEATKDEFETDKLYIYGSDIPEKSILIEGHGHNPVIKIVCGKYHCIILLAGNMLRGIGSNDMGQLGLPLETEKVTDMAELNINIPNMNLEGYQILDIAAGDYFSLILIRTPDNQIRIIKFGIDIRDKYLKLPNTPTQKIEKIPNEVNTNINKIIAFEKRKIFYTDANEIYLGGCDFYGTEIDDYILLKKFDKKINNIFLQKEGCIIQDEENEIYGLNDNSYRELGIKFDITNDFEPFQYKFKKSKIKKISVGARHILFLLENGELFGLGDNSEGQCCSTNSTCGFPYKIEINNPNKIIDCYAGYNYNLVILENGSVYTWGNTDNGKLGYIEDNITQDTPKEILRMKIRCVNYVCLGYKLTIIAVGKEEDSIAFKNRPREEPKVIDVEN